MSNTNQGLLLLAAVIGVPALVAVIWMIFVYNGLITKEEEVLKSWAQVETNLQRRVDLIPNLVSTVRGYAEHEREVFEGVTEIRSGGLSEVLSSLERLNTDTERLGDLKARVKEKLEDEQFMKALANEQQQVGSQLNKLLGVVESYPALRASDQFLALQAQLEGTENRINVTRMVFNERVGEYNASIRRIPGSLMANLGSFQRKAYFESDDGADSVVDTQF